VMQALLSECDLVVAMRLHAVIPRRKCGYARRCDRLRRQSDRGCQAAGRGAVRARIVAADCGIVDRSRDRRARVQGTDSCNAPARSRALRTAAQGTIGWTLEQIHTRGRDSQASTPEWAAMLEHGRAALAASTTSPRSSSGDVPRRIARALIPPRLRRRLREAADRRLMTPAAAAFDRYKRRRSALYGGNLRGLSAPCEPGSSRSCFPPGTAPR
jgi:hypothetical protein